MRHMHVFALRLLALSGVSLFVASCDWAWMEAKVRLQDETVITLQHRSTGIFRTVVTNRHGEVTRDYNGAADSRHVNLYKSLSGRIIVADYGVMPMIVEVASGKQPAEAAFLHREFEYKLSPTWQYIGSVRRTDDSMLQYFPDDPECQKFREGQSARILRKVTPCRDPNYIGL